MATLRQLLGAFLGAFLGVLVFVPLGAAGGVECGADIPCRAPSGRYYALPPPGWNGRDRLPLLMHLHDFGAHAADLLDDRELTGMAARVGVLLVLPDGLDGAWSFTGAPSHRRDDVPFLRAVLADARRRWPVDERLIVASGFAVGGAMVWELACHAADAFTAFLPISGGLWQKLPDDCDPGPVNLRHVDGRRHEVAPMAGDPDRQGDGGGGFVIWQEADRCGTSPDFSLTLDGLDCSVWSTCRTGRQLQLCLHDGGPDKKMDWIADGLEWARSLRR